MKLLFKASLLLSVYVIWSKALPTVLPFRHEEKRHPQSHWPPEYICLIVIMVVVLLSVLTFILLYVSLLNCSLCLGEKMKGGFSHKSVLPHNPSRRFRYIYELKKKSKSARNEEDDHKSRSCYFGKFILWLLKSLCDMHMFTDYWMLFYLFFVCC